MRELQTVGAAGGEVTGSAHVATTNAGRKILIDCGTFQGARSDDRNREASASRRHNPVDGIVITHGHLDHTGLAPIMVESNAEIAMNRPTYELANVVIKDARNISPEMYPPGSIEDFHRRVRLVDYNTPTDIGGVTITLTDAGHILGSSSVTLEEPHGDTVVFSGDVGNPSSLLARPAAPLKGADVVIMETTYGDREHAGEDPHDIFMDAIKGVEKRGGTLLIPSFAIDRTQHVLHILKELAEKKLLADMPVFLDSPMGAAVTRIYESHKDLLSDELREQDDPFNFSGLHISRTNTDSFAIHKSRGPKIIVAGSGMMKGGRIERHAAHYLPDKNSAVLLVGYATEGTPSRALADGENPVRIGYENVEVNATVLQTSSLSAHAGQSDLLGWLKDVQSGDRRLRTVVLVHGDDNAREAFAGRIREELKIPHVVLPKMREVVDLYTN